MATLTDQPLVDQAKLQALVGKAVGDLGATLSTAMISLGDRLGLFQALASGGAATPAELATRTGTVERYVRMAGRLRSRRICRVRPGKRPLLAQPRTTGCAGG